MENNNENQLNNQNGITPDNQQNTMPNNMQNAYNQQNMTVNNMQNTMPNNMPNFQNNNQPIMNYQPQNAAAEVLNHMNNQFSNEDLQKINELSNSINLKDSVSIMSYGSAAQNKMIQFSENTLSNVMNKDLGEVGDAITDVITELKGFDIESETKGKGLFGFFKKAGNNLAKLKTKYTNVETNIDNIVKTLEAHQRNLLKDISILDQMYNYNLEYLKELEIYIEAGKQKLNQLTANEIPALEAKATASNSPQDVQMARDIKDL